MGDHFWPSMYPGLIVGVLIGLAMSGWLSAVVGAAGGLVGAAAAHQLFALTGIASDLAQLAALLAGAGAGACVTVRAVNRLRRPRGP